MAAKAKYAAKRAAASKKLASATVALVQHDPSRPPPLSLKDQTIFKEILHQYEHKQYTPALKNCNDLLAKNPGHGETTAMAGLLHHSLQDKPLGYSLVKAGMKADLKSHIVWHVYGIMTRADRNYAEALKSYSQALKIDPHNNNILRDLAILQIQMREYGGYVESRWRMLCLNRRTRTAWISLAVAYVLNDQKDAAVELLDAMEDFEVVYEPEISFERSALVLFRASITSPPDKALQYLESHRAQVLDKSGYFLARARLLTDLDRVDAAEWAWLDLLDRNTDNRTYLEGYIASRTADAQLSTLDALTHLTERYPDSKIIQRSILDHASGTRFETELQTYLSTRLAKGIPSVFNDLKPLLADPQKADMIRKVAERLRNGFEPSTASEEPPSTYLWVLHFLAQLYSSRHFGLTKEALETAQLAIHHTPTLPDLYLSLAHVYKRAGAYTKSANALRVARELDGQDRFLNSKCAKYILRSMRAETDRETQRKLLEESRGLVALFTRKDAPDPVSDLVDMQAVWYVMEEAEACLRVGDWGLALKRLHQVVEIFQQWEEDQYDFHTYCMRKSTIQSYLNLLSFEDGLYERPQYFRAISQAIKIYLALHDRRAVSNEEPAITEYNILDIPKPHQSNTPAETSPQPNGRPEESEAGMSKKAMKKAKTAEIKAKAQAALEAKRAMSKMKTYDPAVVAAAAEPAPEVVPPVKDDDLTGEKLVKTERPLEVAIELLNPIEGALRRQKHARGLLPMQVSLLRFEIELRKEKPLLALKALLKARASVESICPDLLVAMKKLQRRTATGGGVIETVIGSGIAPLVEEARVQDMGGDEWRVALVELGEVDEESAKELKTWEYAVKALELVKDKDGFRKYASQQWALVEVFMSGGGLTEQNGDGDGELRDY